MHPARFHAAVRRLPVICAIAVLAVLATANRTLPADLTPATELRLARPAAAAAVTTAEPQAAVFDGFDGKLGLDWLIRNADLSHVSLTKRPGTLTITTQKGGFYQSATNYKNLYLIENPIPGRGDFDLTTCLVSFTPAEPHNQAGLICFDDPDNYIKFTLQSGTRSRREFALTTESGGRTSPRHVADAPQAQRIWLRLTKRGSRYAYSTSTDGKRFRVYSEVSWGSGAPKWIGLLAKNSAGSTAPEIDASFDLFQLRRRSAMAPPVYRYVLPAGGGDVLGKFLVDLRNFRPQDPQQQAEYDQRAPALLRVAAQQVLRLEQDEWSTAYQTALVVMLEDRLRRANRSSMPQLRQVLEYVQSFLKVKAEKGLGRLDLELASAAGRTMADAGYDQLAAEAYTGLAKLAATNQDEDCAELRQSLVTAARRFALLGQKFEVHGRCVDGTPLDWSRLVASGEKVVLIQIFAASSPQWQAGLPAAKLNYRLYHDRGLEVLGIAVDEDRQALKALLQKHRLPWETIHEKDLERPRPFTAHYGVTDLPAGWLVDRQGKLVSLRARGDELARQLQRLIGPPDAGRTKLVTLVPAGSVWKWLHPAGGVDPAAADEDFHATFSQLGYDDSGWQTGRDTTGPQGGFGYGDRAGVVWVRPESANRKTAYLRHSFKTHAAVESLVLRLQRDDGIIVYLDGREVGRDNVGDGKEAYGLFAENVISGTAERRVNRYFLTGSLEAGEHVLAISLHNRADGSFHLRIAEISLQGVPAAVEP